MKKTALLLFASLLLLASAKAQYMTRTGHITVQSSTDMMDIVADNYQVFSSLDPASGNIKFAALVKSFEFQLALANEVFNDQRLDARQHPKIEFDGTLINLDQVNFNRAGTYDITVKGSLKVWGESRWTTARGKLTVGSDGNLKAISKFVLLLEEKSIGTANALLAEEVPRVVNVDPKSLGLNRKVNVNVNMTYNKK